MFVWFVSVIVMIEFFFFFLVLLADIGIEFVEPR